MRRSLIPLALLLVLALPASAQVTWSRIGPVHPPARALAAMAFDAGRDGVRCGPRAHRAVRRLGTQPDVGPDLGMGRRGLALPDAGDESARAHCRGSRVRRRTWPRRVVRRTVDVGDRARRYVAMGR